MTSRVPSHRIDIVDRLRGIAVVGMFFVHSGVAWLEPGFLGGPYWRILSTISGMVAPVFMFLVGVSVALIAQQGREKGLDARVLRRNISVRGLKIIALGYVLHLAFFLADKMSGPWIRILKVDILHCIGFGLALFPWVAWPEKRLNWRALALFFALVAGSSVTFRVPLEQWLPAGIAAYFSVRPSLALFPVVPYAAWIALGLFIGAAWAPVARDPRAEQPLWIGLLLAAILVNLAGLGVKWLYYNVSIYDLDGYDEPDKGLAHWFLFKAAWVFVVFGLMRVLAPLMDRPRLKFFVLFGRTSLFAYVVHLFFVYHLGGSHLLRTLGPKTHLLAATALTVFMYGLVVAWRYKPLGLKLFQMKRE